MVLWEMTDNFSGKSKNLDYKNINVPHYPTKLLMSFET